MHILKKLYPRNGAESYLTTTSLVFIAEGYTAAQETQFYQDVDQAFQRILDYHNLINLRLNNNTLSVYTLFIPGAQSGIASNATEAINRTPFESYLSNGLHLNYNKIKDVFEDTYFGEIVEEAKLSNRLLVLNDEETSILHLAIPVFIFPHISTQIGEYENLLEGQYYYIATTIDGYYEQVILRSLCKILGLGDEFELEGTDYLEPDEEMGESINLLFPNLYYTTTPQNVTPINEDFKWGNLFTAFDTVSLPVHAHPGSVNDPDRSLPPIPFSYKNIELWEGGCGFRKKVYRSAYDCLLRRCIGDITLPLKTKKVSLCPICQLYLTTHMQ